ncbi:MAG: class I tRNA ligase family protein [Patescibacteria group bacterium]
MYDHKNIDKKWQKRWEEAGVFQADDKSRKPKYYCLIEFPYPSGAGLHVGHPRSYTALDVIARKRRMEGFNVLYPIGWDAFGLPTENFAIKTGRQPQDVTAENIATFKRQLKSLGFSFDWSREVNTTDPEYYKWTQWMFLQFFKAGLAYKKKMAINWCPSCKIGLANEEVVNGKCERCGGLVEKREKEQWMIAITKYADRLLEDLKDLDYLDKIKKQQEDWIGKSEGAEVNFVIASDSEAISSDGIATSTASPRNDQNTIKVFTTRPDTLFGATYMVLAPEHPLVAQITTDEHRQEVADYVEAAKNKTDIDRADATKEKTGVFTGAYAINPVNDEKIPVWVADYVMMGYGTGAIMAVPAHDERDFEFAKKFDLPIRPVVLKDQEQFRSYVMGMTEKDLQDLGVTVIEKTKEGYFKILIPFDKLGDYQRLIEEKLEPGFWNEFSTPNDFNFIFKHKDGKIEEIALNESTNDLIDKYGMTFNGEEPKKVSENVYSWLAKNDFYRDLLIHSDAGVAINSREFNGLSTAEFKKKIIKRLVKLGVGKAAVHYKLRDWVFSRQRYWGEPIPLVNCEKCGWVALPESELPLKLPVVEKYEPTDSGESPLASIDEFVNTTCPKCGGPAKRETDTMPNWAGSSWYFLRYIDPHNDKVFANKKKLKNWMPIDWYNGGMEHTTLHLLYSRFWNKFLFDQGFVPTTEPYAKRTSQGLILAEDGSKMSKSKGNVVNPDEIVEQYGADSLRVYELFMGPFGEPVPWSTNGLKGVRKFLDRVMRLADQIVETESEAVTRSLHQTIRKVSEDVEAMHFNTAVAQMMMFVNDVHAAGGVEKSSLLNFLQVLAPFAPHAANELNERLGGNGLVETESWPEFDAKLALEPEIEIAVQVNGKLRASILVASGTSEKEIVELSLSQENVKKFLSAEPKKTIYVAGKLVNFVI